MMTLRKLKLKEFEKNEITLDELKEALLRWYYPQVYKQRPDLFERDMEREIHRRFKTYINERRLENE